MPSPLRPLPCGERFVGAFDAIERCVVECRDKDLVARRVEGLSADGADRERQVCSYFFGRSGLEWPGGPVWSWLGSPFPHPGREGLVAAGWAAGAGAAAGAGGGEGADGRATATGGAGRRRGAGVAVRALAGFFGRARVGWCLGLATEASSVLALGCAIWRVTAGALCFVAETCLAETARTETLCFARTRTRA
jgi:hypothetical protein